MRKRIVALIGAIMLVMAMCLVALVSCKDEVDDKKPSGNNPFGPSEGIELPPVEWEPDEEF